MKKILQCTALILILLSFTASPALAADQNITFSTTNARFIPKLINGINQNWFVESPVTYNYVQEAFDRIGTNLVRFPGGTVANYYDWETFAPDWEAGTQVYGGNAEQLNQIKSRFETLVQTLDPITTIRTFNQHGKQVILTLNVFSNTPEQIAIGLNKIKAAGLTPKYFELGNEMHAHMPMQPYFQKSKAVAQKVKTIFPNAQIGLVARVGLWRPGADRDWPETDNPPNEDWFDAVIFHPYMSSGSQMPPAQQINHILFDPAVRLGDLVSRVNTKYPGKKLWLTEWNIWETFNEGFFMTNTYAYAVFHYNFLLSMLKYPAITIANHHILWTSRSWQFALLIPKKSIVYQYYNQNTNPPNNTYSFDQFFAKSPAFWPMEWIGQAFRAYNRFTRVENDIITAVYFFNENMPDQGSIAIINKTADTQNVTFSDVGTVPRTASVMAEKWLAPNSESAEIRPRTKPVTNAVTLAPYAIAYLSPQSGTPTQNPADLVDTGDTPGNQVNQHDADQLKTDFGKTGAAGWIRADINDDGRVDIFDYNILVGRFGE